jgi:MerR family transcriptional regulator, light-induced transcriptional regulator
MERKSGLESRGLRYFGIGPEQDYYASSRFQRDSEERESRIRNACLSDVVADNITPCLRRIHHGIGCASRPLDSPGAGVIAEFAAMAMLSDSGAVRDYFDKMRAKNYSLETLFVYLLAPAARYLSELLDQDLCDLLDFTMGVARLQQLLLVFGAADEVATREGEHRALLLTIPGERHVFDRDLLAALMRGAGWETSVRSSCEVREAAALVSRERFGVVSVTLGRRSGLETAAAMIEAVRRTSCNASISVMVGGPVFAEDPGLAVQAGADAAAQDAPSAVILARKLLRDRVAEPALSKVDARRQF